MRHSDLYCSTLAKRHDVLRRALRTTICAAAFAIAPLAAQAQAQNSPAAAGTVDTLGAIKARGYLICGISGDKPGFSFADSKGVMQGIDVDLCRSVAAAIFGDPAKARFTSLTSLTRFPHCNLAKSTSSRDIRPGLSPVRPVSVWRSLPSTSMTVKVFS